MVEVLGLSNSVTPTPTPPCDVLVIAASNGQNLLLAERFAAAAHEQGQSAAAARQRANARRSKARLHVGTHSSAV
jgi:hypothetical protein